MKNIKLTTIIGLMLSMLAGCGQYSDVEQSEIAELTFKLATSGIGSRGNVTDYPNIPSQWSQAEKVVDGRYLYTLSVYLVDAEKRIVASKENIKVSDQATEVTVTFDKSYNLKRGLYTLMAVANNANHTIGSNTYNTGLSGSWQSADYNALMNNVIKGNTTHNVSPKDLIQPLSLMKTIELHAGNNAIEGELKRTFARIRIEVKNNSGSLPLKIKKVSFTDNFTQKEAYVFDDGSERKYFGQTGAPTSTSDYALQPFAKDAGSDSKIIESQTSEVIFDSYLLESKVDENEYYKYTLDLVYDGATSMIYSYYPVWNTQISNRDNLGVGAESYFLIYNNNCRRYLSANSEKVTNANLSTSSNTVATDHVWQLISSGANKYYIKNVETGLYMQAPTNNSVLIGSDPVPFTFENNSSNISFKGNNNYYVSMKSSGNSYTVQGVTNKRDSGCYFKFYKVNKNATSSANESITYNTPITLTTIDPVTQQSSPTKEIKRNDFINVLVTVSYNPHAGKFEFYVEGWNEGGGSVEFE